MARDRELSIPPAGSRGALGQALAVLGAGALLLTALAAGLLVLQS